ncbi:MAG: GspE/PulE/PilB domain-containing protein [Planctomycetota bacterium]|jgi:hypothetical protein
MKNLLIKTAERTGIVDAGKLNEYLEKNLEDNTRLDEQLLHCPFFTEESVLKLFSETFHIPFLKEISPKSVPPAFIEAIPATYAQHHYVIGIKENDEDDDLTIVLSKPLDADILDNVSKMIGVPVNSAVSTRTVITADCYHCGDRHCLRAENHSARGSSRRARFSKP